MINKFIIFKKDVKKVYVLYYFNKMRKKERVRVEFDKSFVL